MTLCHELHFSPQNYSLQNVTFSHKFTFYNKKNTVGILITQSMTFCHELHFLSQNYL